MEWDMNEDAFVLSGSGPLQCFCGSVHPSGARFTHGAIAPDDGPEGEVPPEDLLAAARHESEEDRRIAALMHQERNRDAMLRRAEVTDRLADTLRISQDVERDLLARLDVAEAERDIWRGSVIASAKRVNEVLAESLGLRAERDAAQEHVAYHLRDFRPGADDKATGDLAVDMAAYAGRLKARADAAEAMVTQVQGSAQAWWDQYDEELTAHEETKARLRAVEAVSSARVVMAAGLHNQSAEFADGFAAGVGALAMKIDDALTALSSDAALQAEVCSYCLKRPAVGETVDLDPICDDCAEPVTQDDGPDPAPRLAAAARAWRERQAQQEVGVTREAVGEALRSTGPVGRAWRFEHQGPVPSGWVLDFLAALGIPVADAPAAPEGERP